MILRLVTVVTAILVTGGAADAQPAERRVDYRKNILVADVSAIAITGVGLALFHRDQRDALGLALVGGGVYASMSPIVHAKHGRGLRSAGSLLLRVSVPLFGGMIGSDAAEQPGTDDGEAGAIVGLLGGMVAVTAIDVLMIAQPIEARPVVYAAPAPGGGLLTVAGTF